jgi:carbonic anhydrase
MREIGELVDGYRAFKRERWPREAARYRELAAQGQAPRIMVIACCDSRVDPGTVFNARPGELFVVRNVANLVPPHEPHGEYHGTSAAVEFAVTSLGVEHIVVMGHARCGGVKAFLDGHYGERRPASFIERWISMLRVAHGIVARTARGTAREDLQGALERQGVVQSIENLETFPFVRERMAQGRVQLHGAYFDVASGILQALDPESGTFAPL